MKMALAKMMEDCKYQVYGFPKKCIYILLLIQVSEFIADLNLTNCGVDLSDNIWRHKINLVLFNKETDSPDNKTHINKLILQ